MATTCPSATSYNAVIQLNKHFSNSAGLMAQKGGVEAIVGRNARDQVEKSRDERLLRLAELGDGHEVVCSADDSARGNHQKLISG